MRTVIFIALAIVFSTLCSAQQKQTDTSKVKFTPPIIVKDKKNVKKDSLKSSHFTPPVIVKDKVANNKKTKPKATVTKFTPPVIVKDSARNQ